MTQAMHADVRNAGTYSRPAYRVSYYSERINAGAFRRFESRAKAAAYVAIGKREGWLVRPTIKYDETHNFSDHY